MRRMLAKWIREQPLTQYRPCVLKPDEKARNKDKRDAFTPI